MAKPKTPKIRYDGPVSVLYDRGSETIERVIDGIVMTGKRDLPDIYRIVTDVETPFYLTSDGKHASGKDADLAAEFAAIEGAKTSA